MPQVLTKKDFAHVVGTFDLAARKGTIDFVTPVRTAIDKPRLTDEGIHLIGENAAGGKLFDVQVNPQRNSCAPHAEQGTFEEYLPVTPELAVIRLTIRGDTVARFTRGTKPSVAAGALALGPPDPSRPNRLPLVATAEHAATPGVTYTVQAMAEGASSWQTLALGLKSPTTHVDVNQFPGAKSVRIRVLQSDGFSESQIFEETKKF
jgi:hypothetical protein